MEEYNQDETLETEDFSDFNFQASEWYDCTFKDCELSNLELTSAKFSDTTFINCDLSNARVSNSRFLQCKFVNCKLVGVNWGDIEDLREPLFENCLLDYSYFAGIKIHQGKFNKCRALEADFTDSELKKAIFKETDLSGAIFSNCDLREADFREAINYAIDPVGNRIRAAKFSLPEAVSLLYSLGIQIDEDS